MYESAKNELKENNNGFGYLFVSQAATPPAKWIPTVTLLIRYIELQTVNPLISLLKIFCFQYSFALS